MIHGLYSSGKTLAASTPLMASHDQAILARYISKDLSSSITDKIFHLVKQPLTIYVRSGARFYLPFFYTYRIKKLNHSHIIKQLLLGQWALLAIAIGLSSPPYLLNTIWLLLLNVSCAIIYEIGYWENDAIGEKYEDKPVLSKTYARYRDKLKLHTAAPWYWAIGVAVFTFVLQEISVLQTTSQLSTASGVIKVTAQAWPSLPWHTVIWICYLIAIRVTFGIYNRLDEISRIWIYPILQAQRLFGFALLLPLNTVGAILLMSLVISRWINYTVYRCGGDRKMIAFHLPHLCVFTISFLAFVIGNPTPAIFFTWQSAIAFIYCTVKGLREASRLGLSFSLVDLKQ